MKRLERFISNSWVIVDWVIKIPLNLKIIGLISLTLIIAGVIFVGIYTWRPTPPVETPTLTLRTYGREVLKTSMPPAEAVKKFLPDLNYSWELVKSSSDSSLFSRSPVPRIPKIDFKKNVSANLHGFLATPLIDGEYS